MDLTVRPASYVGSDVNSGGWTRSGGAASDWETLRSASDSTYLYDGTVSGSVATSFYTDCIDQDIYNGSPSTISKITVYARAKMDSNATPATIALTERDATGTRQPSSLNHQNLTTSWVLPRQLRIRWQRTSSWICSSAWDSWSICFTAVDRYYSRVHQLFLNIDTNRLGRSRYCSRS